MKIQGETVEKFKELLSVLFEFDAGNLDFGIYRIMNYRRREIEDFIEKDLIQAVQEEFELFKLQSAKDLLARVEKKKKEIEELEEKLAQKILRNGQIEDEFKDKPFAKEYLELKRQLAEVEVTESEQAQVFNDLYTFFLRYYEDGDFISKRRYSSRDTRYAIPYNGEEAKLYWANFDQYYVKTGEVFKDYEFSSNGWQIVFRTTFADVEAGNVRGERKYFFLAPSDSVNVNEESKTCLIQFEYRQLTDKDLSKYKVTTKTGEEKKAAIQQDEISALLIGIILGKIKEAELKAVLSEKTDEKTILERHLYKYTHKITSDFFIHKNLKGFLERELDYFIKTEVLDINNLDSRRVTRAEVVENIGKRIIEFLSQIEEYQKLLWDKKKFVLRTDYVITTDRIPGELLEEVQECQAQLQDWQDLGFGQISKKQDLNGRKLPVDTKHFDDGFKERLLEKLTEQENLDDLIDGILIKSENWQALNLLLGKYQGKIQCIYIDPPFNTGTNEFLYKNNYLDSSWLCMLFDRLVKGQDLLNPRGNIFVRIDHHGDFYVRQLLDLVFGRQNFQNQIIIRRGRETAGSRGKVEIASEKLLWFSGGPDSYFYKIEIPRPISQVQWTAFLMGGERHPRERVFIGKTLVPPDGQHFALGQPKVDRLLDEYFLRLRCRNCGAFYFKTDNDSKLQKEMKKKQNRYKFYDIGIDEVVHGVQKVDKCVECGADEWVVDYLGAPTENVSNIWIDIESYARTTGFFTENSESLLRRVIESSSKKCDWVLDYFLGSATTTAVAHKLGRRWIGVEMGDFFEDLPLTRMKRVLAGDKVGISKEVNWQGGGFFKYHYLEQYEDTLHGIEFPNEEKGQLWLKLFPEEASEYVMKYMLRFETEGSPSLLNLKQFEDPFEYKLGIISGGKGVNIVPVDLVETFNYLLGLVVIKYKFLSENGRKYVIVLGEKGNRRVAVVWRPTKDIDLKKEREVIDKAVIDYHPDEIFINGDAYIKGYKGIENEFKALMGV
jgi:adenine-specific DNA-methyltransferase